jgi:hypothetical protein
VADVVDDQPQSYEDVARAVGGHPKALRRALRCLAAYGVFKDFGDAVGHNEASRLLRTDHPSTQSSVVKWAGSPIQWRAYGELEQVLKTGECALGPGGLFGALEDAPEEAEEFDRTMEAVSALQVQAIATGFDFSVFPTICDVGGGRGHLLSAIMDRARHSKGILVDLPGVIGRLPPPMSEGIDHAARDILNEALPSADAYILKNVLHDWSDEDVIRILNNVRSSGGPKAKIILAEALLPDPPRPTFSLIHDLAMLVLNNGQERTLREFETLLGAVGLRCEAVVPVQDLSLVIAERAE